MISDTLCNADTTATTNAKRQFQVGDHVFKWCSYMGIPFSYQEHGIVVAVAGGSDGDGSDDKTQDGEIVILNFDQTQDLDSSNTDTDKEEKCCCMTPQKLLLTEANASWEHVQYNQQQWHVRLSQRAGTCTPESPDPTPVVLYRIQFLKENPTLLSTLQYDSHKRNGECIATWCQTGQYKSAQGSAKMGEAGMHVGTFNLAGGIAAQLAVGAVVPVLLPFMAAMDVGDAVVKGRDLLTARQEWKDRTGEWNQAFEAYLKIVMQNREENIGE